jgi:hypothetical protein
VQAFTDNMRPGEQCPKLAILTCKLGSIHTSITDGIEIESFFTHEQEETGDYSNSLMPMVNMDGLVQVAADSG